MNIIEWLKSPAGLVVGGVLVAISSDIAKYQTSVKVARKNGQPDPDFEWAILINKVLVGLTIGGGIAVNN